MAVDCNNTLEVRNAVCQNATDMQEMITLPDDGTLTTNYSAKPVSLMVKEQVNFDLQKLGITYVWENSTERNAQTGMTLDEQGYQIDTDEVYKYDGTNWNLLYTIGRDEYKDDVFRIIDNVDSTKKLAFNVDAVTTGTTRTISMPDTDVDLRDFVNKVSSTDKAIVRFDGADGDIKNSPVTLDTVSGKSVISTNDEGFKFDKPVDFDSPELITNGTFDSNTGWTKDSEWTISGGVASIFEDDTGAVLYQPLNTIAGHTYIYSLDVSELTGGISVTLRTSSFSFLQTLSVIVQEGTIKIPFTAINDGDIVNLSRFTTLTATIDNISVKEVHTVDNIVLKDSLTLNNSTISNWVGTVSQNNGVLTGAIIESGSNANGVYTKYADGTAIAHNENSAIATDPITFIGTPTSVDNNKLKVGRWY